jgi:chromosome segregation ATPase
MNNTRIAKTFAILLLFIVVVQYKTESGLFKNTGSFEQIRMAIEYMIHGENGPLITARHDNKIKEKELAHLSQDSLEYAQENDELKSQNHLLHERILNLLLQAQSNTNDIVRLTREKDDMEYEHNNLKGVHSSLEAELDAMLTEKQATEDARDALARKLSELPAIAENLKMTRESLDEAEEQLRQAQEKLHAHRDAERGLRSLSDVEQLKLNSELATAELKYSTAAEAVKKLKKQVGRMQKELEVKNNPQRDFLDPKF